MNHRTLSLLVLGGLLLALSAGPRAAEPITAEQFSAWLEEISNWGRWGEDDELGTLNLITPEKRKAAAGLVRDGVTVSLALDLNKKKDAVNVNPFEHTVTVGAFGGHEFSGDRYAVAYHGFAHSHVDGLPHFATDGLMYNGVPVAEALAPGGWRKLGIENAHAGIFTRGVLVDMARFKGVEYLEPGTAITAEDLEAWEKRNKVQVQSGDVLLVRTGRWERVRQKGQWDLFEEGIAGLHVSVAKWLKTRDVAVIGCDAISDVMPSGVADRPNPLHELVLVGLGMPVLDNLDLDAVAREAAKRNRWQFLFVGAPLRVPGGTGSPLNPLAVF